MNEKKLPIKRSSELVPLSRDHHNGLLLCWKIRQGINKGIDTDRIAAYISHVFDTELAPHFELEEQVLFSLIPEDEKFKRASNEHLQLREIVLALRQHKATTDTLLSFANLLESHIRYEERDLFNYIETHIQTVQLRIAGEMIEQAYKNACHIDWKDDFWIVDK
jgi:hemerythrin-like domain-containing protein